MSRAKKKSEELLGRRDILDLPEDVRFFKEEMQQWYEEAVAKGEPGRVYFALLEAYEAATRLEPHEQAIPGVLDAATAVLMCDFADDIARMQKSTVRESGPVIRLLESGVPLPPLALRIIADWLRRRTKPDRTPLAETSPANRRLGDAIKAVAALVADGMPRAQAVEKAAKKFKVPVKSMAREAHGGLRRSERRDR